MTEGVDYAWSRPNIAQLYAAGKRFACRYVSYDNTGKNLTAAEAAALSAGGIAVVTTWEWSATDQLGGYNVGVQHAWEADRQHRACGGPPGRPIYFATDFDATAGQLAGPVTQYLRGAASVLGLARVGVYGGIRTVRYVLNQGLARWAWQTYAWSGGAWEPRSHIQQYRNGVVLAGATLDLDRAMTADFGQWTVGGGDMLTDEEHAWLRRIHQRTYALNQLLESIDLHGGEGVEAVPMSTAVTTLVERPPVQSAPVDPAALKAVLLDPEVMSGLARAVADELHRRMAE